MAKAYYNENDPKAAAWLRELIKAGQIAPGEVDERSIEDVTPNDLSGFDQAHFFAGIGGWSLALRRAGWPDDRPVWTGSCPCQPFSAAGKRKGTSDERHLWPSWFWLISQCRPRVVFGEQVADAIKSGWLDLVSRDLEGVDYAVGAAVLAAGGISAPHLRKRLWFVANTSSIGHDWRRTGEALSHSRQIEESKRLRNACKLADTLRSGWPEGGTESGRGSTAGLRLFGELGDADAKGLEVIGEQSTRGQFSPAERTVSSRNPWADCDWIYCTDGKWRPVEPGTFPLAHGIPARLGRLRGYGNAIVPQVAAEIIRAYAGNSNG